MLKTRGFSHIYIYIYYFTYIYVSGRINKRVVLLSSPSSKNVAFLWNIYFMMMIFGIDIDLALICGIRYRQSAYCGLSSGATSWTQ